MKIATIIVRTLMGLIFIYASAMFFLKMAPETEAIGAFKVFQVGILAANYVMPLAKAIELICGIAFLTNKFTTLANIVILPVTLNILLINVYMTPENLPIALFIFFGNIFLIVSYWKNYKGLFTIN